MNQIDEEYLNNIIGITQRTLPNFTISAVYRIPEDTPVGPKVRTLERRVGDVPTEYLFAGVLLVCPANGKADNTQGLEINTGNKVICLQKSAQTHDALALQRAYSQEGYNFIVES